MDQERRLVLVQMTGELAESLFTPTRPGVAWRVSTGLPEDAVCVGMNLDPMRSCVMFTFSHPSFRRVPLGDMIPFHDSPTLTRLYAPEPRPWKPGETVAEMMSNEDYRRAWGLPAADVREVTRFVPGVDYTFTVPDIAPELNARLGMGTVEGPVEVTVAPGVFDAPPEDAPPPVKFREFL